MEHIAEKLDDLKDRLNELKNINCHEGNDDYESIKQLLERIIDRTYPEKDAQDLKTKLDVFAPFVPISSVRYESARQNRYLKGITKAIRVIDTILIEYELFGLDDFEPVKTKIETELKVGLKDISYRRKKTK